MRLPPRHHLAGIFLAAALIAACAAEQSLEDSGTNETARTAGNALASRPHSNPPLPTEMVWTESGNTYVGLGGDLYSGAGWPGAAPSPSPKRRWPGNAAGLYMG